MKIRTQLSMVLNLEKCIGCHTCSVTCKNMWTNRKGAEYMWWNNVETKPGTGYPKKWEDQEKYKGGWIKVGGELKLKMGGKTKLFTKIFYNPDQPHMKNYYEPFNYKYENLINAGDSDTQPTARAYSMVTGKYMDIKSGPNWDDDLSGSDEYAVGDVNLDDNEKQMMKELENVFMFYVPRLCNHCVNPACVASCPSGAIYKRGEDGIVLLNQEKCKSWRYCVTACPYKKVYHNWNTQKSEKCIFCYPRVENGQATICSTSCVGKIRSIGVIFYDENKFLDAMKSENVELIEKFKSCILDPNDASVIEQAKKQGISHEWLTAAQRSPVYKYLMDLQIALPLHPEFRTFPSIFYVPPLSPVVTSAQDFDGIPVSENLRIPVKYLAKIFTAGNEKIMVDTIQKVLLVRSYLRAKQLKDEDKMKNILSKKILTEKQIETAFNLFTQATIQERFVIPLTEMAEASDPYSAQGNTGFGIIGKKGVRK